MEMQETFNDGLITQLARVRTDYLSCKPGHAGEIFQMIGSVVNHSINSRFIIERVDDE